MREADTIGADKYFHCKANAQAVQHGSTGAAVAINIAREATDFAMGDGWQASVDDMRANNDGLNGARNNPGASASEICAHHRPDALDPKYK